MNEAEYIDKALGANITEEEQIMIGECVTFQERYDLIANSLRKHKNIPKRLEYCISLLDVLYQRHADRYHHVRWAPEVRRIEKFSK